MTQMTLCRLGVGVYNECVGDGKTVLQVGINPGWATSCAPGVGGDI